MAQGVVKDCFEYVVHVASSSITGQDRASVFVHPPGLVIALADGAGGTRNGAVAAQALVDAVGAMSPHAGPIGKATLIVASDGLFRYGKEHDIARIARGRDLGMAARALVELVRLPSGTLQDDVAVVLCRALELGDLDVDGAAGAPRDRGWCQSDTRSSSAETACRARSRTAKQPPPSR